MADSFVAGSAVDGTYHISNQRFGLTIGGLIERLSYRVGSRQLINQKTFGLQQQRAAVGDWRYWIRKAVGNHSNNKTQNNQAN